MRVRLILKQLETILAQSAQSRDRALALFGTAAYLTDFLLTAANVNKIGNITGVKEKLREYMNAIQYHVGLLDGQDLPPYPDDAARSALAALTFGPLLGEKKELLEHRITKEGEILHQ